MSTLVVELPDEQIDALKQVARQRGITIDTVVAELVSTITVRDVGDEQDVTTDPLYNIAAHTSNAPADLSQNVDHYLYGAASK
jgi:hypothetical protein